MASPLKTKRPRRITNDSFSLTERSAGTSSGGAVVAQHVGVAELRVAAQADALVPLAGQRPVDERLQILGSGGGIHGRRGRGGAATASGSAAALVGSAGAGAKRANVEERRAAVVEGTAPRLALADGRLGASARSFGDQADLLVLGGGDGAAVAEHLQQLEQGVVGGLAARAAHATGRSAATPNAVRRTVVVTRVRLESPVVLRSPARRRRRHSRRYVVGLRRACRGCYDCVTGV